jgi:hypothetical protein
MAERRHMAGNGDLTYEELLRVLGRLIDDDNWHEVVVTETNGGVLLKGIRLDDSQPGAPVARLAEHWYARAELRELSAESIAQRRGARGLARLFAR